MPITQGFAPGSAKALQDAGGLFAPINKTQAGTEGDNVVTGEYVPELSLSMDDEELLALSRTWEREYTNYYTEGIQDKQKKNYNYWLGKQQGYDQSLYQTVDNVIFESLETFLPIITQRPPEPLVLADNTEEGIALTGTVQKMLAYVADEEKLKTKIKSAVRHWALDYVGIAKVGYDFVEEEISITIVDPKKLIFDPTGMNRRIGEQKTATGTRLSQLFPGKKGVISEYCDGKLGTEMNYTEWWTKDFTFWQLKDEILLKVKNPHWNYDSTEKVTNAFGLEETNEVQGSNHFKEPQIPYISLNVFSVGKQPHDETSVVEQSIPLQDGVNKRTRQIDKNADDMNNGWIVSSLFSKDQAKSVADAVRRGGVVQSPTPDINGAIQRVQAAPLPNFIPEDRNDKRNEIANMIGVSGSTAQGVSQVQTVRGMQMIQQVDANRFSLITDFVEQFVDDIFNWMVQMMKVYYTEDHIASLVGQDKAVEMITLNAQQMNRQLIVTVREGSMIPQDPLSRRNTALDLWKAGAIDPISLYERLDDPNPRDSAHRLWQWQTDPGSLFGQPGMMQQPAPQQQLGAPPVQTAQEMPPINNPL